MRSFCMLMVTGLALLLPVFARAASHCTVSANNYSFGNYDPMNSLPTNVTGTNLISVTCNGNGSAIITVDLSPGGSGVYFPSRQLATGFTSDVLNYNLYTTASLTTVWGDGTGGSGDVVIPYAMGLHNFTVYGQIPAQQNIGAGSYADSITVTVTF